MIIKKFQGNTETEAITKARDELGKDAVVMNVKTIKPRGVMKLFKPQVVEVTAALEENSNNAPTGVRVDDSVQMIKESAAEIRKIVETKEETKPEFKTAAAATSPVTPKGVTPSPQGEGFNRGDGFNRSEALPGYPPSPSPASDITKGKALEENLERLQELLRAQIATEEQKGTKQAPMQHAPEPVKREKKSNDSGGMSFVKMIYNTLVENEVDEHYVNQIMSEMDNVIHPDTQIDSVLSNLYTKLNLKFGRPECITLSEDKPTVAILIGPTGVGKTTTIAKLATVFKEEKKKQVAFLTADTYRISATEQLKTYADIIGSPVSIVYSVEDMAGELDRLKSCDLILVDTAGYSHKNKDQQQEMKKLIDAVGDEYNKEVFLVLSATTKYADLKSIADAYKSVSDYTIIFTKLDETDVYGNLLNVRMYSGAPVSYTTNGQNVPADIEVFNSQRIVKLLLGGNA